MLCEVEGLWLTYNTCNLDEKRLILRFVLKQVPSGPVEFEIEFVKLKDGRHSFNYHLEKAFFEAFGNEDVLRAAVAVEANIEKFPALMNISLQMHGTLGVVCDRCLETIDLPVKAAYTVVCKLGAETETSDEMEEDSELVILSAHDFKINISHWIYESVLLALPMLKNCDNLTIKPCNKEMLKRLNELSDEGEESTDPRWEKLKELFKKDKK